MTAEHEGTERTNWVDPRLSRNGKVSYLEIPAVDPGRSANFYEKVFGWKVGRGNPDHISFDDGTGELIGRWSSERSVVEPGFLPYIYVDRVAETLRNIVASGGEIEDGPRSEGNLLIATFRDPAGNLVGVWQKESE